MSTSKRGERTRQAILDAAGRLFALQGYHVTGTTEILQAVSVSKGAFYHHFASKQDLALAVLQKLRREYRQFVIEPVQEVDTSSRLLHFIGRILYLNRSGSWYNCLLLSRLIQETSLQQDELGKMVTEMVEWLLQFLQEIIIDAQARKNLSRKHDPRSLAELIFSGLLGAVSCKELDPDLIGLEKLEQEFTILLGENRF